MQEQNEMLKMQVQLLEKEAAHLKEVIFELENRISTQDVIIDALVHQAKATKTAVKRNFSPLHGDQENTKKVKGSPENSMPKNGAAVEKPMAHLEKKSASTRKDSAKEQENAHIAEKPCTENLQEDSIVARQIKDIFVQKQKSADFKVNFSFKKFVEYAESAYEFSLTNKKASRLKNPLKLYTDTNLDKIVKYIIDNIGVLNLNQICSPLFMINSEIEYNHKLVIAHDILLEIDNPSKLLYICSALFNNFELQGDLISQVINKIMYHQYCIETDLSRDEIIYGYLDVIKNNFSLAKDPVTLWKSLPLFLRVTPLFSSLKDRIRIESSAIESGFALRALCHYLDWDYTYNGFVVPELLPAIEKTRAPLYIYYAGVLAVNAYRIFGREESVLALFQELLGFMEDTSDCSIACYLILKQVHEAESARWLENGRESLLARGISMSALEKTLLF